MAPIYVVCYIKPSGDPATQWKIALPEAMLDDTIHWFLEVMGHLGRTRL